MRSVRACQTLLLTGTLVISPAFASHAHRAPTSGHAHAASSKRKSASHKPTAHEVKGQRGMDPIRAREIQTALVRENYLTGEPTGDWDEQSQQAMQRYQADHNWQTRIIPDSRALIKLGLGPSPTTGSVGDVTASAATPTASAQTVQPPAQTAASPATPRTRKGASSALTLADAHSIFN